MLLFLAIALVVSWLVGVAVLHIPGGAIYLLLPLALAALAGHIARRRLILRRLLAAHRDHAGVRSDPPLLLRTNSRGQHYIVS